MRHLYSFIAFLVLTAPSAHATSDDTQLAVWANEAIVATYTFDHDNYMARQKEIAKYFTASGWMAYSKALNDSGLPAAVQKNAYYVSAVATMPPIIKPISATHWQATMPLLVVYKNPQYIQKQTLQVTIDFSQAPAGQGIRGLAIMSLQADARTPACQCDAQTDTPTSITNGKQ